MDATQRDLDKEKQVLVALVIFNAIQDIENNKQWVEQEKQRLQKVDKDLQIQLETLDKDKKHLEMELQRLKDERMDFDNALQKFHDTKKAMVWCC